MCKKIGFDIDEVLYPVDGQCRKEYVDASPSTFIEDCAADCGITIEDNSKFHKNILKTRYKGLKYLHDTMSGAKNNNFFWKEVEKYGEEFYKYVGEILDKIGYDEKFNYDKEGK